MLSQRIKCYTNSPLVDPSFFFIPLLIKQTWRNGSEPESFPFLIDPSKKCQFHFPGAWSNAFHEVVCPTSGPYPQTPHLHLYQME